MFKRQFYAVEHADNDDASSSDSSVNTGSDDDSAHDPASDSDADEASSPSGAAPGSDDSDSDSDDAGGEPRDSASEDDEWDAYRDRNVKLVQAIDSRRFLAKPPAKTAATDAVEGEDSGAGSSDEETESVGDRVVLRIGGVLKCRLCVKVICLNDETMKTHLLSKGHARSVKQLASGKLKVQLNSDGEEEEEGETHAERLERIRKIAETTVVPAKRKANSGRQRQRKRSKQKAGKAERAMQKSAKQKSG